VGQIYHQDQYISTTEFDTDNIIAVTEADLRDEQKQAMAKAMEKYKQLCLKSFSVNRSGEVIEKQELPMPFSSNSQKNLCHQRMMVCPQHG